MATIIITKAVLQPVTPLQTAFQEKLALSLLPSDPYQNRWSTALKSLHRFVASSHRRGAIPAFPHEVKQDHIEERHVVKQQKLHRCNNYISTLRREKTLLLEPCISSNFECTYSMYVCTLPHICNEDHCLHMPELAHARAHTCAPYLHKHSLSLSLSLALYSRK